MAFQYSCFISYRREVERNKFVEDFCKHLNPKAKDATNIDKIFIDTNEIKNGVPFPTKIYESIIKSCVFIVFNTQHYLNEKDTWCAKELCYALKVEEKRKEALLSPDKENYNFFLILMVNGSPSDLPFTIENRNAHSIKKFEYFGRFIKSKESKKVLDDLGDRIDEVYKLYQKYPLIDFSDMSLDVPIPSDEEIICWIKLQRDKAKKQEANHLPILKLQDR